MALSDNLKRILAYALGSPDAASELSNAVDTPVGGSGSATINTTVSTVGAATLTAAALAGKIVTRGGVQVANFTDTTDTAALIIAAQPSTAKVGQSWSVEIYNTTAFTETIAGGTGVTVSGFAAVPALSSARFLLTYTAANAFTMVGLGVAPLNAMPDAQYITQAYQTATLAAGDITGAETCHFNNTGTTPGTLTTRTAAQMFADIPNCQAGRAYTLFVRNSAGAANTLTLGAGTNVTLTGTMTVAQNVTRMFEVVFVDATHCTIQSMGTFAAGL